MIVKTIKVKKDNTRWIEINGNLFGPYTSTEEMELDKKGLIRFYLLWDYFKEKERITRDEVNEKFDELWALGMF